MNTFIRLLKGLIWVYLSPGYPDYFGDRLYAFCFAFILARRGSFHGFPGFNGEDPSLLGVDFAPLFEDCADICEEASA